uniref:Syndecan n=1 Tax=Callithrix jacchus TaxID=9483 RepID=A0A5F4WDV4_CALJA
MEVDWEPAGVRGAGPSGFPAPRAGAAPRRPRFYWGIPGGVRAAGRGRAGAGQGSAPLPIRWVARPPRATSCCLRDLSRSLYHGLRPSVRAVAALRRRRRRVDDLEDSKMGPKVIHPLVSLDNHIPERAGPGSQVPAEPKKLEENEVIPKRISPFEEGEDVSNKVSMSSTVQGSSIFERTEVLAALIVGGIVGILFAVFLILLLVYRMKKKDEGSYDLGKKPIYKKAPTNEFYA